MRERAKKIIVKRRKREGKIDCEIDSVRDGDGCDDM